MPTLAVLALQARRGDGSPQDARSPRKPGFPCDAKHGTVSESLSLIILHCRGSMDALLSLERMLATGNVPILVVRLPSLEMLTVTELLQGMLTTLPRASLEPGNTLHLILAKRAAGKLIGLLFAKKISKFDVKVYRLPNGEKIILAEVKARGGQLPVEDVAELPSLPLHPGDTGKALHQIEEAVCSISTCSSGGKTRRR